MESDNTSETKLHWGSKKDEQQCAHMATHAITDSKHGVISDALTPSDRQGHFMSGSSDSNNQLCQCLLNAVKSHHPLAPPVSVWFERIILYKDNMGSILLILPMSVKGQDDGSLQKDFQVMKKWKAVEVHIDSKGIWMWCNLWLMSRLQTIFGIK